MSPQKQVKWFLLFVFKYDEDDGTNDNLPNSFHKQ